MPQTQEEFYFGHPYERMDLLMWGQAEEVEPAELAARAGLKPEEVETAYAGDRAPPGGHRVPARPSDHRRPR